MNILKRVRTWASGPFTLNANGDTQNCLFYHSFDDEIFCYYNIEHFRSASRPSCGGCARRGPQGPDGGCRWCGRCGRYGR